MDINTFQNLLLTGILRGGLYALMAVGLALVFGVMNICHFAHGEYYVIGAYAAYFAYVDFGLNPILAIIVAALISFIAGAVTEKVFFMPLRRLNKGEWIMNAFLLTAGLSVALQNSFKLIWGVRYRGITQYWDASIEIIPGMAIAADRLVGLGIAILAILALWFFLQKTNTGRAIRAVSQDERGAMLVGIKLDRIYTTPMLAKYIKKRGGDRFLRFRKQDLMNYQPDEGELSNYPLSTKISGQRLERHDGDLANRRKSLQ